MSAFSQKKTSEVDSLLNTLNDTATVRQSEMVTQAPPVMDKKWNKIRTKAFTLNIGFCMLVDHNILVQDGDNIAQVGEVASATEFRADRLILSGSLLFFKRPWRYMFSANYNGLDAPQGKKTVDMIDWNLEIPIGAKEGWLTIGKQKEGVGLEYIMPGTQGQFMERSTGEPMLVKQRNVGIRYSNSILNQRMTYTAGFFNNYWETGRSFSDNGSQVTARISALPHYVSDRDLVHLGVAYRYTTATEGSLTYKAKPEANTAPSFVSTGSFAADHAGTLMFEGLAMKESVMVMAEYMSTSVRSEALGHPNLWYWQVGAGWFVTGENRRYNRITGNPGKLVPSSNFKFRKGSGPGAIELATRITQTNGTDAGITGGKFTRFTVGVNWFTNAHFRYTLNYGYGQLVRDGLTGYSSFWQFRIQFEL
ncbi:MAG: OprO/OprP family phosphate-selective porin [Chitinophagaceae bacterium]|nr:OprO/OprP family phosphate-selective porin [Chitinophagaceae bacterium]